MSHGVSIKQIGPRAHLLCFRRGEEPLDQFRALLWRQELDHSRHFLKLIERRVPLGSSVYTYARVSTFIHTFEATFEASRLLYFRTATDCKILGKGIGRRFRPGKGCCHMCAVFNPIQPCEAAKMHFYVRPLRVLRVCLGGLLPPVVINYDSHRGMHCLAYIAQPFLIRILSIKHGTETNMKYESR